MGRSIRPYYAEHLIGAEADLDRAAVIARSQTRGPSQLTFGELREQIARARAGLHRLGVRRGAPLEFDPMPFHHPLYVLFSSGTTGRPKAIVHGHGGIVLEHCKAHALSWDVRPGDRMLWFTTTSWMMWNSLVSALLLRGAAVLIDGDPAWPSLDASWAMAAETSATIMGVSPASVTACRKAGLAPGAVHDLSRVRIVATAGSPLPDEGFRRLARQLPGARIVNGSGGTDVCTAIVTGTALTPVEVGEIAGPALGVAACAYDPDGRPIVGELGELVITRQMPSMPVGFWGDPDGSRYRAAYFEHFPGVWRHGDWIRFSAAGRCVVTGRSEATLNRGGVRLGTGEFYEVVQEVPEIADALVVHLEDDEGGPGELLLFVELAAGAKLDDALRARIAHRLRAELSPRHAPDAVIAVPGIPQTLTGKRLEAPVKRVLRGARPDEVASLDALRDPRSLEPFAALARVRRARS